MLGSADLAGRRNHIQFSHKMST